MGVDGPTARGLLSHDPVAAEAFLGDFEAALEHLPNPHGREPAVPLAPGDQGWADAGG